MGLLATGLMLALGCSQQKETDNGYHIKGQIKGLDSGMVKLTRSNSDRTSTVIDSARLEKGSFEFNGSLEAPELLTITVVPGNWSIPVFAENSEITVHADTAGAEHYDYTAYGMEKSAQIRKSEIKGSAVQDVLNSYEENPEQLKYKAFFAALNKRYEAAANEGEKEALRVKFDSVGKLSKTWQKKWIDQFVAKDPASGAGAYIFSNYYTFNTGMPLNEMDALLAKFKGEARKTVYFGELTKQAGLRRALLPGKPAPDFTLMKRDSSKLTLSSFRGKYVMIDFWASWCKPCREAIPHWKSVYNQYKAKGFEILSVSDDSRWADWTKAMDAEKMPWAQVIDEFPVKNMPARVGTLYQTHFIPFYVLLDKEGKILVYSGEESEIDSKLREVFGS